MLIRDPNSTFNTLLFQDGSTQQLKPYNRRSSRATLRPLSRKDIFYSGSVYNLALEMQEQKMMTDQSLLKGRVLNPWFGYLIEGSPYQFDVHIFEYTVKRKSGT